MLIPIMILILKDEAGVAPLAIASAVQAGGQILGGLFGKKKKKVYDPLAQHRQQFNNILGQRLGINGDGYLQDYQDNSAFELDTPEVQNQAEQNILGRYKNLPQTTKNVSELSDKYYQTTKTRMRDRHQEELDQEKERYNRLGLLSSTPGLHAETQLGRRQADEFAQLESQLAYDSIDKEMAQIGLNEDIQSNLNTQAYTLGQAKKGDQQYQQTMSMDDLNRKTDDDLRYMALINSILSGNPAQVTTKENSASKLGSLLSAGGDAFSKIYPLFK